MDRWKGKVALVTGAASGIGAATSRELAKHGVSVIGCDVNLELLKDVAEGMKGLPGSMSTLQCDLSDQAQIEDMFRTINTKFGGVDILINNAGTNSAQPLLSGDVTKWQTILNVNVLAVAHCAKLAVRSMRAKNTEQGQIVNICSNVGHMVPDFPDHHFYTASKHAVKALTDGLRNELEKEVPRQRIRVAQISPGTIKTNLATVMYNDAKKGAELMANGIDAENVAQAIIYLLAAPPAVQIRDIHIGPMTDFVK